MPNAKVLTEKQAIVAALVERMKNAESGVFVDYKGISVEQDTALRRELRAAGVDYSVVKNTLTRFAANQLGYEALDPILNGTTSLATSTADPIAPIRIVNDYAKKMDGIFTIKAGFMDGQLLSLSELAEIAELPSKDASTTSNSVCSTTSAAAAAVAGPATAAAAETPKVSSRAWTSSESSRTVRALISSIMAVTFSLAILKFLL